MKIFKLSLRERFLIYFGFRKPPKFKVGDNVADVSLRYICQDGIIESIKSDWMFSYWGYKYIIRWNDDEYRTSYSYQNSLTLIEPPFKEYKYDQSGDTEDDI